MLKLIIGRSGSGKTEEIIKRITESVSLDKNTLLIVPEQQVYSCERNILPKLPSSAGLKFEILSFSRLAQKSAALYGGIVGKNPSNSMKSLLMWRTLKETSSLLEAYGNISTKQSSDISLTALMLATVNELKYSGKTADDLMEVSEKLGADSPLAKKFRDIATVSNAYDLLLTNVYGANPLDRLSVAAKQMGDNNFFRGYTVFIDSFTSFTAQEYEILKYAIRDAEDVHISLCADPQKSKTVHFLSTEQTKRRLTEIAGSPSIPTYYLSKNVRAQSLELSMLEKYLWDFEENGGLKDMIPESNRGAVTLLTAENAYDEAEAAALNIRDLVNNNDVPYGNIAVIVRDTAKWEGILDAALDAYSIPYFISERTEISSKPLSRLILSAIRAVSREWQSTDIMDILKTGLTGIPVDDIDMFEDYVFTWNISGKKMTDTVWSMNADGYSVETSAYGELIKDAANRVRAAVMEPLLVFKFELERSESVTDQCRAICNYLNKLNVREQQIKRAESLIERDRIKEAGEEMRLWSFVNEAMASLSLAMDSKGKLSPAELEGALTILFTSTDIGSVPARHDSVIIGSAKTLRTDNVRAALVLGLGEGEFPGCSTTTGLFTDSDRQLLADYGITLGAGSEIDASEELMYAYRALSIPSEKLYASYSTHTSDGKKIPPSVAFMRMCKLLNYIEPYHFSSSMIRDRDDLLSNARAVRRAYENITGATAKSLLGNKLHLTQSKIDTFAKCPYSYYSEYVLKLHERCRAELGALSSGNFLHHVLEKVIPLALNEDNTVKDPSELDVSKEADKIIESYLHELCGDSIKSGSVIHQFGRMRTVTLTLINSILDELRQSRFRPFGFEVKFSDRDDKALEPMTLDLNLAPEDKPADPIQLIFTGKADRIDFYKKDDKIYARVIDYKSSAHDIDFSDGAIKEKLNVQLLIYLFALCSPQNKKLFGDSVTPLLPAGATYVSYNENPTKNTIDVNRTGLILNTHEILTATSESLDVNFLPGVKFKDSIPEGRALCSQDRMDSIELELRDALADTARLIYGGTTQRKPSEDSCKYCIMKESCQARIRPSIKY